MAVTINGSTGIEYDDNVKLIMGTSDDLELYHSGSHSHIKDSGTGHLQVDGSRVQLRNIANDDPMVDCTGGGVVEIFYNGTKKLETHSNGVRVVNTGADAELRVLSPSGQNGRIELTADAGAANEDNFRLAVNTDQKFRIYGKPSGTYTEFLSVDQSGDVKITTGQLDINNSTANAVGDLDDPADYGLVLRGSSTTGEGTGIAFTNDDKSAVGSAICHIDNGSNNIGHLAFYTSKTSNTPVENVRITQNGFLKAKGDYSAYISDTDNVHEFNGDTSGETSMRVRAGSSNGNGIQCLVNSDDTTNYYFAGRSLSAASARMYIWSNGDLDNNNNSYGSLSDIKLKENIVDASSQWNDIKNLKVRNFNFKDNPSKPMIGLIAQEAETVSPGLVDSHPDTDAAGDDLGTTTKSVKYSILYMKAIKALQEAMAKIETLETKVAALEAG